MNELPTDVAEDITVYAKRWGWLAAATAFPSLFPLWVLEQTSTFGLSVLATQDPDAVALASEVLAAAQAGQLEVAEEVTGGITEGVSRAAGGLALGAVGGVVVGVGVLAALALVVARAAR
jgi:hypothetical protein